MRILLVEDDPTLSNQVRQALEEADYAVDLAVDGRDAQYRGETEPFDAAILDLGLPLVDGITVLKSWRAHGISFPVLILTARDTWHEKVAGIDAGADDYLGKPFHMEELLARLRALLRRAVPVPDNDGFAETRRQVLTLAQKFRGKVLLVDSAPLAKGAKPAIEWRGNLGHLSVGQEEIHSALVIS